MSKGRGLLAACLIVTSSFAMAPDHARAVGVTWTVTKTADTNDGTCDTDCSLREALDVTADGDLIDLPGGTYQLSQAFGSLEVGVGVTITGAGASSTHVVGNAVGATGFGARIFDVTGVGSLVEFIGFTVRGGELPIATPLTERGAGISSVALQLKLTDMLITDNHTETFDGGVVQEGVGTYLTLIRTTVTGNTSESSVGGIGGIDANVEVFSSTISNNISGTNGGGIWSNKEIYIEKSTISGNEADSDGGGIYVTGDGGPILDSTISGNTAGDDGGGVYADSADLFVRGTTFTKNNGVGAGSDGSAFKVLGAVTYLGSIVSENRIAGSGASQCAATPLTTNGGNVIEEIALQPSGCTGNIGMGDVATTTSFLLPLANNGGPTLTHAIPPGSPAVDKLTDALACDGTQSDQRGVARPAQKCDAGAYELVFCRSLPANILGTPGNDTINGTAGADGVLAGDGNDRISGGSGKDQLCGEGGNDFIKGGGAKDGLDGGAGVDKCVGNGGRDKFKACEKKKQ